MNKLFKIIFLLLLCTTTFASPYYAIHKLVSDGPFPADHKDPNLLNPMGIAFAPIGFAWIANNHSGTATIYDGEGNPQSLVVKLPALPGHRYSHPTGIIFNGTQNWMISDNNNSAPATFIFATEDGTILGWSSQVNETQAILVVDNSKTASYRGLTSGANGMDSYLYATNFVTGKVDVFDSAFKPAKLHGDFTDPNLPRGYVPFGIQNINGDIYVTYAKQDFLKKEIVTGPGLGIVNVFDADGNFIRRVAEYGKLNAPWGITLAPSSFDKYSDFLLVGNYGSGKIVAVDLIQNQQVGFLSDANNFPLVIHGLWALNFGNGLNRQPTNQLFFTAGPFFQQHGLYGRIDVHS